MGLDMYLEKIKREAVDYKDVDIYKEKSNNSKLYQKIKPYIIERGTPGIYTYESLFEEVMYWRKVNQIHRWFVENVQDFEDDCKYHEVSKEQLEELRDICKEVLEKAVLISGVVVNGYRGTESGLNPIYEEGKNVVNKEICEELLPTCEGFFFGGTNYDSFYIDDIKYTYEGLCKVIEETDFTNYTLFYCSSW